MNYTNLMKGAIQMIDWLIDWLIDWFSDWLIDWLIDWLYILQIQGGDVAVAFSTVEAPSSSTGPSADPSSLYANVTFIQ